MTLAELILVFSVAINILLGVVIFTQNPRYQAARVFLLVAISTCLWSIGVYYTENGGSLAVNNWADRLAFLGAYLAVGSVYLFTLFFPKAKAISRKVAVIIWLTAIAMAVFSFSDLVKERIALIDGSLIFSPGPLTWLYGVLLLAIMVLSVINLRPYIFSSSGLIRTQARLVVFGFSSAIFLIALTNLFVPLFFESANTQKFGPLMSIFLVSSFTYAIVKYKLFDIRLAIARSFAYALTLMTMLITFVAASFVVTNRFFENKVTPGQQAYYVTVSIVLALLYQPIKHYFDKVTQRVFYQEHYDPQEELRTFSNFIATETVTEKIIRETAATLERTVKPTGAYVLLYAGEVNWYMLVGSLAEYSQNTLRNSLEYQSPPLLSAAELELRETEVFEGNLINELKDNRIDLSIKLSTRDDSIGFMLLREKRSGTRFSEKDLNFLRILVNSMSVALQNATRFEEIQKFNETLKKEIDDATKELRDTNEKLKALDEAKDEFISMASHQLRTPLTSVKGYISMVIDGDAGDISDKQREMLQAAFNSSQRMVFQISDLLNVSRLKTGKFVIEYSTFDLANVVENEVNQLKDVANSRGLEIVFDKPDNVPQVRLDENKIRQVMMNFMDNAIYYSKTGGTIEVHLEADDKTIKYWVSDTGIGVPNRDHHKLFTKFFRAANAKRARPDGTGLGLFMAQKIIVAQGGAIIFKSVEKEGSTFGFSFPRSKIASVN